MTPLGPARPRLRERAELSARHARAATPLPEPPDITRARASATPSAWSTAAGPPLRGFVAEHLLPFTGGSLEPFYAHEAEALAAAVAAVKRARRGGDVADAYASGGAAAAAKSELALLRAAGAGALSAAQAKALGAKCGTATPWWVLAARRGSGGGRLGRPRCPLCPVAAVFCALPEPRGGCRRPPLAACHRLQAPSQHTPLPSRPHDTAALLSAFTSPSLPLRRWFALGVLLRYRTLRNWRDPVFLAPRVGDKVVIGSLLAALYWGIGDDFSFLNLSNQSAFLFMVGSARVL